MIIEDGEAGLAYTYAWWLTGDDERARAAVLAAVARPEVPGADDALRVEILLRRVRAAAVEQPTMCPASELALLHDGIGLPLDSAAGLAEIDSREARTELAHGRLEALGASDEVEVVEPERLGGLAVGNPADVAATRQNPKLAALRDMILRGRDELVTLSPVETPADLLETIGSMRESERLSQILPPDPAGADTPVEKPDDADDAAGPAGPAEPDEPADKTQDLLDAPVEAVTGRLPVGGSDNIDRAEEVDLSGSVGDVEMPLGRPGARSSNLIWLVLGVAFIVAVVLLLTSRGEDALPGGDAPEDTPTLTVPSDDQISESADPVVTETATADDPATPVDETDDPTPTDDPVVEPPSTPTEEALDELTITETGVAVGLGADPDGDNPTATPFDPVSFELAYTGAVDGDALIAEWTVDGVAFALEQVDLLPGDSTSRFSRQVPLDGGWPIGQHVLAFTEVGQQEVLAEVRFTVSEDGA